MPTRIDIITPDGKQSSVNVDKLPDFCPHCHFAGRQIVAKAERVHLQPRPAAEQKLYLMMICPRHECGRPYFAVFQEPSFDLRYSATDAYKYAYSTPSTPQKQQRDPVVAQISPDFYDILDQALAAEGYRLTLVAGAGFRKALEYLVKDYVLVDAWAALAAAGELGDSAGTETAQRTIDAILSRDLGGQNGVISLIPNDRLRKVAERAVWLGNDEVHYTRRWTNKDIGDLKKVIGIVLSIIVTDSDFEELMTEMPGPARP